jgi:putative membrane-bound dehydrogenase-like protein
VANGREYKPVDDNLPAFIRPSRTSQAVARRQAFLSGRGSNQRMTLGKGMKISLFASEVKFRLVSRCRWRSIKGRLWVATADVSHWKPTEPMNDKLLILEDTNGDGRADKTTVFAGDLHNPTGFEFWGGGVIVAQAPNLVFLQDTDGDDKYDVRRMLIHGLDTADTHHTANSFTLDPGGALYFQEGTFHHTQVETPWGAARRVASAAFYEPRAQNSTCMFRSALPTRMDTSSIAGGKMSWSMARERCRITAALHRTSITRPSTAARRSFISSGRAPAQARSAQQPAFPEEMQGT